MPAISHRHRVVYFQIPKNATSSLKRVMYELETGAKWDDVKKELGGNIHHVYPSEQRFVWLPYFDNYMSMVIVRHPVSRVLATYGNRVIHASALTSNDKLVARIENAGLSATPDLGEFVDQLEKYQSLSRAVRNHTKPQAALVGEFWDRINYRLPIEDLSRVPGIVEKHTGQIVDLPHAQTGGPKFKHNDLTSSQIARLERLYADDFELLKAFY